jgi:hypothetical protein
MHQGLARHTSTVVVVEVVEVVGVPVQLELLNPSYQKLHLLRSP